MLSEEMTGITSPQNLEELQTKVDRMTDNIINFSKIEKQADREIKERLLQIIEGAKRLKIDKNELQRMFHESFLAQGPRAATLESHVRRVISSNYK
jgi:ABC-type siderophore export system fused ATPase/permease subunit